MTPKRSQPHWHKKNITLEIAAPTSLFKTFFYAIFLPKFLLYELDVQEKTCTTCVLVMRMVDHWPSGGEQKVCHDRHGSAHRGATVVRQVPLDPLNQLLHIVVAVLACDKKSISKSC